MIKRCAQGFVCPGGNEIADSFGLGEIDPAVQEGTSGELARLCLSRPCSQGAIQDQVCDKHSAVTGELNGVLACERAGGAEHGGQHLVDLIAARTDKAVRVSLDQLAGRLGTRIKAIKADLLDLCASLEVDIDFSEEGIDIIAPVEVARRISAVRIQLAEAAATFSGGRLLREGLSVPIIGKPNAGKSSLFNALLKESRAIVTHLPGTTRDFIEEGISVSGVLLRLIDTAGLRTPGDVAEAEGISRTMDLVGSGDIILVAEEVTSQRDTPTILGDLPPLGQFQRVVVARTKADLKPGLPPDPVISHEAGVLVVEVSALTGYGMREIEKALIDVVGTERVGSDSTLAVTNRRHWEALQKAIQGLDSALASLRAGSTFEFVAFDVRECTLALSGITGEVTTEEVLNHIFSRFCIGK